VGAAGGRIVSWHAHFDRLGLLEQLGQTARPAGTAALRRVLTEVFEQGRTEVLREVLSDDFVNHRTPGGVDSGADGLAVIVRALRAGFPDLRFTVEREIVDGDWVAQVAWVEGTHAGAIYGVPPTGRRVRWRQVHIVRMAAGRVAEHWGVSDLASVWVQIGRVPGY
jgi:predicted ester cyclase